MKKLLLLTALAFVTTAGSGFAQSVGAFGYGIELTGYGAGATNSGVETLYALDNSGTTRLRPDNSGATISTSWTGSSTSADPTFNLGTFAQGGSLILDGASFLTYKNSGGNVTGAYLNYGVNSGTTGNDTFLPGVSLAFDQDNVSGNAGDQRWADDSGSSTGLSINLLSGLAPGTYTLETYGAATSSTNPTFYESNGGNNFAATFTVVAVPEPGTWAMMLGGLGMLVVFQIRRRQFVG